MMTCVLFQFDLTFFTLLYRVNSFLTCLWKTYTQKSLIVKSAKNKSKTTVIFDKKLTKIIKVK